VPDLRIELGDGGDHGLGPPDVEDGGGTALLPRAKAVVELHHRREGLGVAQQRKVCVVRRHCRHRRLRLDDVGNEVVCNLQKLFVDLLIVFGIVVELHYRCCIGPSSNGFFVVLVAVEVSSLVCMGIDMMV